MTDDAAIPARPTVRHAKVALAELNRILDEPVDFIRHAGQVVMRQHTAAIEALMAKHKADVQNLHDQMMARLRAAYPDLATDAKTEAPPVTTPANPPTSPRRSPIQFEDSHKNLADIAAGTVEEARLRRLHTSIREGYNPATDALAFAKLEEMEAFDRLAQWQHEQGIPRSVVPVPPGKHREQLAAIGALLERGYYFAHRPPKRLRVVSWVHEGWLLDAKSETDLLRQVYARIGTKLAIPSKKG